MIGPQEFKAMVKGLPTERIAMILTVTTLATIKDTQPTPAGPLFMAIQAITGMPHSTFSDLMAMLTTLDLATLSGQLYSVTPAGAELVTKLEQAIGAPVA